MVVVVAALEVEVVARGLEVVDGMGVGVVSEVVPWHDGTEFIARPLARPLAPKPYDSSVKREIGRAHV